MGVPTPTSKVPPSVNALNAWHSKQSTPTSKNYAIFKETGRCGEWNSMLGLGNPAASPEVQKYLKASTEEQLQAGITPKQAVPLLLPKLLLLARFLNRKIAAHSGLFILARDQAFFKTLLFRGDRGFDLGMVKTEEILRFPQDDGLYCSIMYGGKL